MQTSHIKASLTKLLLLSFARKWSRRTKWSCKVISKKCIAGHITPIKLAHSGYLITSVPFTRFQQDWAAHYIHLSVHSFRKCAMNVNTKYEGDWQKEREKTNREDYKLRWLARIIDLKRDHKVELSTTSAITHISRGCPRSGLGFLKRDQQVGRPKCKYDSNNWARF